MTSGAAPRRWAIELAFAGIALAALLPALAAGQCYFANDLLGQFGAWWLYFKGSLAQGLFPLWNPYNFGGQPFAADPQSFSFYPFFYPFLLLPVGWGLTLFWGFHLWIAARGAGWWLDRLEASLGAQVLGGAVYALSGLFQVELVHPTITCALAWLPWVLASLEGFLRNPRPRGALLTGATFSLSMLSGSPQMTLLTAYAVGLYAILRFRRTAEAFRFLPKGATLGFLLLGLSPLLLGVWPQAEFALRCSRSLENRTYEDFNSRGSLHPSTLTHVIWAPRTMDQPLGDAIQGQDTHGDQPLQALTAFVGPIAFLLALGALFLCPARLTFPILGLGLFGLLLSLGRHALFHPFACRFLPGFSSFQMPCRYAALLTLTLSILSGLCLQALQDRRNRRSSFLFFMAVGLASITLLAVDWSFYKTGPSQIFDYARNMPAHSQLQIPTPPFRIVTTPSLPYWRYGSKAFFPAFPVNASAPLKFRNAVGYNPLSLETYHRLQALPLLRFVHLWSVHTIVSGQALRGMDGFDESQAGNLAFYRPRGGTAAVKFSENVLAVPDDSTAFSKLSEDSFDPERNAILTLPQGHPIPPGGPSSGFRADFLGEDACGSHYQLFAPREGVAIFPDAMFPGWKARIDGRPVEVLTAQSALRAVGVPQGTHRVDFIFRPAWWPWVPILMLLAWLLIGYKIIATNFETPLKGPLPSSGHDLGSMP